jgi:hypothetical protein
MMGRTARARMRPEYLKGAFGARRKTASHFFGPMLPAIVIVASVSAACAQSASVPLTPASVAAAPGAKTAAAAKPTTALASVPAPADLPAGVTLPAQQGPMTLMLRGLDKISGRPSNIIAPIGKPVNFATLTITARYCYSTPASETPETAAFLQIQDHRPDQSERAVFSGWMYASSPGLNAMEHPLYDVWVINCTSATPNAAPGAVVANAPGKVAAPDSSDKEQTEALPAEAGR